MENGEREWEDEAFDYLDELTEVYNNAISSAVYWATGKEYGILKEASAWAECYRSERSCR